MTLAKLLTGGNTTSASIIWAIILGVFIAVVITYINKKTVGKLVNKLLALPADSEENAVTLDELGFGKNGSLRYALRPSSTLSNIIKHTEDGRYYIPEDQQYRAEIVYTQNRLSVMTLVISAVLLIVAGSALLNVLPSFVNMFKSVF
jgi:TctA family transporter